MTLRSLLVLALLASAAVGQNFTYSDFSSIGTLALNGNAAQATAPSGTVMRIASNTPISQKGSVYHTTPMPVLTGFDTTFVFQITGPTAGGGDGMTFIIQNDSSATTALGNHASAMGYGAFLTAPAGTSVGNSIAVEIDTYYSNLNGFTDLSTNEISVHTGGTGDNSQIEDHSIGRVDPPGINMSDGQTHTMRIRYVPGTLYIYLDDLMNPVLTVPYDFNTGGTQILTTTPVGGLSLLPGGAAFVGFTAGCGAATENYDILSWQWTSTAFDPCFAGTMGTIGTTGGPYDVINVNGSAGGSARLVTLAINTPMTISVLQPPSNTFPSNHLIFGKIGFPDAAGTFPVPGVGTLCFPPFGFATDPSLFVFADSFGFVLPTLFPATPSPWGITFPVPFPLQFTLQGVMEESPGLLAFTNAVMVDIK